MKNGALEKLASGIKSYSCNYSWIPDSRYVALTHIEEIDNHNVAFTSVFDTENKTILYTHENVSHLTWSPNGEYYSYIDWANTSNLFAFGINTYDLQGNDESIFSYSTGTPISERAWSSDSQFLLYRLNRTFFVVDLNSLSAKRVIRYANVSPKYNPISWWSPTSNHIFFTAAENNNGEAKNGIYYASLESNSITFVAGMPKFPDGVVSDVLTSPDNQFTVLYVSTREIGIFTIINNGTKGYTSQFEVPPRGLAIKSIWLK